MVGCICVGCWGGGPGRRLSRGSRGWGGTVPLGWALYLPEDWCEDQQRRRKAKIPEEVAFKTKPQLGVELVERALGWDVPRAPVLGDHAYGENTSLRDRLHESGCEYVLSVGPKTKVFAQGTSFAVSPKKQGATRGPVRPRPDRQPEPIGELIDRLGADNGPTVTTSRPTTGSQTSPLTLRPSASPGWRACAGRWSSTTNSSKVSSGSTTTKAAPGLG